LHTVFWLGSLKGRYYLEGTEVFGRILKLKDESQFDNAVST
jgi:hypothetical protein